jgi:predicted MFS family arabinose efflux permease
VTPLRMVSLICAAQVLVQIGAFVWPALMPGMIGRWSLTNSEAGWITAAFYAAYIPAVPVLVTLTDRIDAKRVYLVGVGFTIVGHAVFAFVADGFWSALLARALTGIGWAGTYMTGLKLLADKVDAKLMSRAAAGHAASVGISGAMSFVFANVAADFGGWRFSFVAAAASAALAWAFVAFAAPGRLPAQTRPASGHVLFDFRPVLRNRSAMAYAIAYCLHTFELSALRGWGVAFLGYVALSKGIPNAAPSPAVTLTALGLLGTLASVLGNEAAIFFGRRRLISFAMIASAGCAALVGFVGTRSYLIAVGLMLVYGPIIWLDSSSLTAGTAGTADPARRGATLALHSMLGYVGGFIGPLAVGWALDLQGGNSSTAWAAIFAMLAVLMLLALVVFLSMRPEALAGDRGEART